MRLCFAVAFLFCYGPEIEASVRGATSLRKGIFDSLLASRGAGRLEMEEKPSGTGSAAFTDQPLQLTRTKQGWYTAELSIAGGQAHLAVDTGSSTLWIRQLPGDAATALSASNASSAVHFSAQYGRGGVSGEVRHEAVVVGAGTEQHSCAIGRVSREDPFWARQKTIDGLLGLGCDDGGSASALKCLLPEGEHQTFTLQLDEDGGSLSFGDVPPQYQGNLVFMPPTEACGHWAVPLLGLSAAGQDFLGGGGGAQAILDSGSDGIVGPTFAVIALAEKMGATSAPAGEGYGGQVTFYTVKCSSIDLPDLTFSLGDASSPGMMANLTLPGQSLIYQGSGDVDSNDCRLRLVGWETQSWILGRAFMTHLKASVFDVGQHQVALAL